MCFSAGVSFGAGIALSVIGVASLKKVQHPAQILFAAIPLLFSVQQLTEGLLWLSLSNPAYAQWRQLTTYIFLFFAQVAWPLFVPLSILLVTRKDKRKAIQKILVVTGAVVGLYLAYCLIVYPVEANIIGNHISYKQDYPFVYGNYVGALYIIATIAPSIFSGFKRMWYLGISVLISYVITSIFYTDYIVSVWCFFASIISIVVLVIMDEINKSEKTRPPSFNPGFTSK